MTMCIHYEILTRTTKSKVSGPAPVRERGISGNVASQGAPVPPTATGRPLGRVAIW
jgi:hypothetical protein